MPPKYSFYLPRAFSIFQRLYLPFRDSHYLPETVSAFERLSLSSGDCFHIQIMLLTCRHLSVLQRLIFCFPETVYLPETVFVFIIRYNGKSDTHWCRKMSSSVTIFTCTREVPSSNLGQDSDYLDWHASWPSQTIKTNSGVTPYCGSIQELWSQRINRF
jgi:hypothetical protein